MTVAFSTQRVETAMTCVKEARHGRVKCWGVCILSDFGLCLRSLFHSHQSWPGADGVPLPLGNGLAQTWAVPSPQHGTIWITSFFRQENTKSNNKIRKGLSLIVFSLSPSSGRFCSWWRTDAGRKGSWEGVALVRFKDALSEYRRLWCSLAGFRQPLTIHWSELGVWGAVGGKMSFLNAGLRRLALQRQTL